MPVDHSYYELKASKASNTGNAQSWMTAWDSQVVAEAGTIRAATFVARSLTSNGRANQADVFLQPSGVSAASNSSSSVLTAAVSLTGNNTSVSGTIAASNQRVAAGDILQLKTNESPASGLIDDLRATVVVLPD